MTTYGKSTVGSDLDAVGVEITPPVMSALARDYRHSRTGIRAAVGNVGSNFGEIVRERELAAMVERQRQVSARSWRANPNIMKDMRDLLERRSTPPIVERTSDTPPNYNSSAPSTPLTATSTAASVAESPHQTHALPPSETDYDVSDSLSSFLCWLLNGAQGSEKLLLDGENVGILDGSGGGSVDVGKKVVDCVERDEGDFGVGREWVDVDEVGGVDSAIGEEIRLPHHHQPQQSLSQLRDLHRNDKHTIPPTHQGIITKTKPLGLNTASTLFQKQRRISFSRALSSRHHLPVMVNTNNIQMSNSLSSSLTNENKDTNNTRFSASRSRSHLDVVGSKSGMLLGGLLGNEIGVGADEVVCDSAYGTPGMRMPTTFSSMSRPTHPAIISSHMDAPAVGTFMSAEPSSMSMSTPAHPTIGLSLIDPQNIGVAPSFGVNGMGVSVAQEAVETVPRLMGGEGRDCGGVEGEGLGVDVGGVENVRDVAVGADITLGVVKEKGGKKHGIFCRLRTVMLGPKKKGGAAATLEDSRKTLVASAGDLSSVPSATQSSSPPTVAPRKSAWFSSRPSKTGGGEDGKACWGVAIWEGC